MRQPFVRQYEDPLAEEDPLDLRRFKPVPVPAGTAPQNTVNGIPKLDLGGIDVPDDAGSSDSYGPLDAATDPMAAAAGYGIDLSQAPAAAAPPTAPGPTPAASDYWRQQASTLKQQQIDQGTVRPSGWRSALALLSSMALGHRNPQAAKAATDWIVGSDPNVKAAGKLSRDAAIAEQMAQQERQQDYQNTLAGVRTQMARTNALKASEADQNRQQAEKDRQLQRDTARSEWIQQHGGAPIDDLAPVPPPPGEAPPVNVQSPTVAQYATEGTTAAPNVTGGQGGVSPAIAGAMAANAPKMGDTIKGATRTVDPLSGQKVLIPSIEDFNAQQAKAKRAAAPQISPEIAAALGHPEIEGMNDREAALALKAATPGKEPARDDKAIAIYAKPPAQRTPEEVAYLKGYEQYINQTKTQPGVLRMEVLGNTRMQPGIDTSTGAPQFVTPNQAKANPNLVPAGVAVPAMQRTALLEDIRGNVQQVRDSLQAMPDFDTMDKTKIALALRSRDPRGTLNAMISGGAMGSLSAQQQDYLINVTNLVENAMAMRSVLGAGQGSEDLRSAITSTIPGPTTPNKAYAQKQLDTFEKVLNRLERGIPKVPLRTDTGITPPASSLNGGGGQGTYKMTATGPNNHKIGSNDGGKTWVDVATGRPIQ